MTIEAQSLGTPSIISHEAPSPQQQPDTWKLRNMTAEGGGVEGIRALTDHLACLRSSVKCCVRTILTALRVHSRCAGTVPRERPPKLPVRPHCYPCPDEGRASEMPSDLSITDRCPNPHPDCTALHACSYSMGLDGVPQTPVLPGDVTLFGNRIIADAIR